MKKWVAILIPLAFCLVVASGCSDSGDVDAAKALVKSGDARLEAYAGTFLEVADGFERLFVSCAEGTMTDPDEIRQKMDEYQAKLQGLLSQLGEVEAPFKKVLAMEGVEKYKEYAELRLKMAGQAKKAQDVVARTFPGIEQTLLAGKRPDSNGLQGAKRELIGIEMEHSFMEVEAEQLDEDYGLTK